ncbi:primosomal protein N' [Terrarubrum flagellatum]|uniref:primosomal protein N' n=1 Tax=Terrirubrum flagellatum TaxID=2895980 RepID=UPI003144F292
MPEPSAADKNRPIVIETLHDAAESRTGGVADVLAPVAVDTAYSYAIPPGVAVAPGDVVAIPLGRTQTVGVVWSVDPRRSGGNLKPIEGRVDAPAMPENVRKLVDWIAGYTLASRGMVARMAIRLPQEAAEKPSLGVRASGTQPGRMTPARGRVMAQLESGLLTPKRALAEAAGVSASVIDGLVDEGVLLVEAMIARSPTPPDPDHGAPRLDGQQIEAADALVARVRDAAFSTTLLEGVTGSGKTEVYFEAVAECLRLGRQALILLPEIALTTQFRERFEQRFGVPPAEWHSGVGSRKRDRLYERVARGEEKVVVGARSALFLPFTKLGLIIVDEEHETAYKQEDLALYHARDMSVVRGRIENCPVILSSATPSLETRVNAMNGRYAHVKLPQRFGARELPKLAAIDLRKHGAPRGRWIAPALDQAMRETLDQGEQTLLFLNRRGYAPLTLCRACGHRFRCDDCSAWLVEHRFTRSLRCHHCGHREKRPDACPNCGALDSLTACGPGVERLAEEVATQFPDKRALVLSSDMPGGAERLRQEFQDIADGKVDIVIGTQLVAKGHNFPGLTCVGVIDADLGLASGDLRASERTFQLMQQVTGRAGRGEKPGRAFLQTHQPDHPVMTALLSGDVERFYAEEIELRRDAGLPPFGRLAAIIVSATAQDDAVQHARALARNAPRVEGVTVLGPAEAPLALVRGRHRYRLLVKAPRGFDLSNYLRAMIAEAPKPVRSIRAVVDVDPQSFF